MKDIFTMETLKQNSSSSLKSLLMVKKNTNETYWLQKLTAQQKIASRTNLKLYIIEYLAVVKIIISAYE